MQRKIVALILSIIMIFSVVGCSNGKENIKKGGYIQETINIDENLDVMNIFKDGDEDKILVQGYDSTSNNKIYISEDLGKSWSEKILEEVKKQGENTTSIIKTVLNNEEIIIETRKNTTDGIEINYSLITSDEQVKDLQKAFIDEDSSQEKTFLSSGISPTNFIQLDNGDILYKAASQDQIAIIDSTTFKEKIRYDIKEPIETFAVVGENIIVKAQSNNVLVYDLSTGVQNTKLTKLQEAFKKNSIDGNIGIIRNNSKDKLFFYSSLGLFFYSFESEKIVEVADSTSYFSNQAIMVNSMVELGENDFVISMNILDSGEYKLLRYKYDKNLIKKPKTQVKLYSLEEDKEIRRYVSAFNSLGTDIAIKYEIGYTGGMGITKEDAIKKLNTELMAGKGPDILVLNNLPEKSYEKEGVLSDLTSILSEYKEEELFTGVIDSYKVKNKIYRLPIGISIPFICGETQYLDKINDINSLAQVVKELDKKENNLIFTEGRSPDNFISSIYFQFGDELLTNKNKVNEENLSKFMEASEDIYKIYISKIKENDKRETEKNREELAKTGGLIDNMSGTATTSLEEGLQLYPDKVPTIVSQLGQSIDYGLLPFYNFYQNLTNERVNNENFAYEIFAKGKENIFIPRNNIAINGKSRNREAAKEVVKYFVLDHKPNMYTYISINKKIFEETLALDDNTKKILEFDKEKKRYILEKIKNEDGSDYLVYANNNDDINKYISDIDKLNMEVRVDIVLLNEIANEFNKVIRNGLSVDEGVDNVVKNLELYLSE